MASSPYRGSPEDALRERLTELEQLVQMAEASGLGSARTVRAWRRERDALRARLLGR